MQVFFLIYNNLNPPFTTTLDDYNARLISYWLKDKNTSKGTRIDALTSSYGLHQMISKPTHLQANSLLCTDLIFTN